MRNCLEGVGGAAVFVWPCQMTWSWLFSWHGGACCAGLFGVLDGEDAG